MHRHRNKTQQQKFITHSHIPQSKNRPLSDGQEVGNNPMNCAAYSIYSQALLTTISQEFSCRLVNYQIQKRTNRRVHIFFPRRIGTGFQTPSAEHLLTQRLYNIFIFIPSKKYFPLRRGNTQYRAGQITRRYFLSTKPQCDNKHFHTVFA